MEKQANFKTDQEIYQEKFNKTTAFLGKFIFSEKENFEMLKKVGFMDCYISDPEIMDIITLNNSQKLLFLLFKNKKLNLEDIRKMVTSLATIPVSIVFSYELVNDYSMVVIEFPESFNSDYENVIEGKYSKLSEDFKSKFPVAQELLNSKKQVVGKEYTIYYHIFNKTDWLKEFWMKRLNLFELDDRLELWGQPDQKDLVFDINNILNK